MVRVNMARCQPLAEIPAGQQHARRPSVSIVHDWVHVKRQPYLVESMYVRTVHDNEVAVPQV